MGMMPELIQALEDMEWFLPRPVQQEAVPLILGGDQPPFGPVPWRGQKTPLWIVNGFILKKCIIL